MTRFDDTTLRRLGRALPNPGPTATQRQAVLDAAARVSPRPARDLRPLAAAAIALLALGGGAWQWRAASLATQTPQAPEAEAMTAPLVAVAPPPPEAPATKARAASILSSGGATFEHAVRPGEGLEQIRLEDGRIELEVAVQPGRRFLLVADNATARVEASRFVARARGGALSELRVVTGRVTLEEQGRAPRVLEPDARWTPGETVEAAPPSTPEEPAARPRARRRARPRPPAPTRPHAPRAPSVAIDDGARAEIPPVESATSALAPANPGDLAERRFQEGWRALSEGDYARAADALEAAIGPSSPVAEEAGYWRAIALMLDHRDQEAEAALQKYIRRYPETPRRADIALLLGQFNLTRGAYTEARRWLSIAAESSDPKIRRRAKALHERAGELEFDFE